MRSILSRSGHTILVEPAGARRVNRWLLAAAAQCRAIRLGDLQFVPAHLHVGRGTLGRGFRTGIHTHTDFQIEYVLFGSVRVLLESGEVGVLKPGDGIVLPPGVEHGLEVLTDAGLLGALIRAEGKHTAAFCGRSAAACREGGTRFGDADAAVWAKQMINAAACDEFGGWEAETVASLLRLWLRVGIRALVREASWEGNNGRRPSKAVRHDQQEALRERALSFIRANSHRAIRAEDVARDLAISTRHLNRLFRAAFSETATQSITRHRLTQARRLLTEDPRLQIKEAAAATGYERVSYFSYCFRRQFGYPPSQVSRTELAPRAERENHGTPELAS